MVYDIQSFHLLMPNWGYTSVVLRANYRTKPTGLYVMESVTMQELTCIQCQEQKPESAFDKDRRKTTGRHSHCKECRRERVREIRNLKMRPAEEAKKVGCLYCTENRTVCLDLHHEKSDDKLFCINRRGVDKYTMDEIKAEIQKCIIVCSNCHRLIHAGQIL